MSLRSCLCSIALVGCTCGGSASSTPPRSLRPSITPGTSASATAVTATVSCPTPGTLPYLTTDGSTPTTSALQAGSATFASSGVLKAICGGPKFTPSPVATATYTITPEGTPWVTAAGAPCTNGPGIVPSAQACEWKACKDEPLPATVYYVCSEGGDDARSPAQARDPATPWATVARAVQQYGSIAAGEAVAFCRGGTFLGGGMWQNANGTQATPTVVRDYTRPGREGLGDPRPIFTGKLDDFITPGRVRFMNLAVHGNGTGALAFAFKNVSDITFCNLELAGGDIGMNLSPGGDPRNLARVRTVGSRFIDNANQGWLGAGTANEVRHCYFHNNGSGNSVFEHSIYSGGASQNNPAWLSDGEIFSDNEIHPPAGAGGVVIVVHGIHTNMVVENNRIVFDRGPAKVSGWAIAVGGGGYAPQLEFISDLVIRGNTVVNAGNMSIGVAVCQDCLVENNVVINTQQATRGVAAPLEAARDNNPASSRLVVRNNTVYLTAGGVGIQTGLEGGKHVVANNAVQSSGSCYLWEGGSDAYAERDYNAYRSCADAPVGRHAIVADPQWTDPGIDLRPMGGSPLVGVGDPTQRPVSDITGAVRPATPSVGAYEP